MMPSYAVGIASGGIGFVIGEKFKLGVGQGLAVTVGVCLLWILVEFGVVFTRAYMRDE